MDFFIVLPVGLSVKKIELLLGRGGIDKNETAFPADYDL
jgi:hypothetical protein